MAQRLGLAELEAHALDNIGTARVSLGDRSGLAEIERAAALALEVRSPEAARALNNLSSVQASLGEFGRQRQLLTEAVRVGRELGALTLAQYSSAQLVGSLIWTGSWDDALHLADDWLAQHGGEASSAELGLRRNRARVLFARDDVEGALDDIARALDGSRQMAEPQVLLPALSIAARTYLELGQDDAAREVGGELMKHARRAALDWRIVDFAFVAAALGHGDELRQMIERLPQTKLTAANLALVSGDYVRAADLLDEGSSVFAAADARWAAAAKLAGEGRQEEAGRQLERALAFYRSVGATRYIRDCEALRRSLQVPA